MWHARINEHVDFCADRRESNSCQQLKKGSLNFWQKMKWDTYTEKLLLPNIVSLDSGSCYSKQLLHSEYTEQPLLWKSVNSHAENPWHGSYILIKRKIWRHFLEDNYFSQYCLKTFHKTSTTFLWKWFVLLFYSLFVFLVGHWLLTYSGRYLP